MTVYNRREIEELREQMRAPIDRANARHVYNPDEIEELSAKLALWEAARPAIAAMYGGSREALTDEARRAVCNALAGKAAE